MKTFTDMRGKRGKIGSIVYFWMDDFEGEKNIKPLCVSEIYKAKRTRLLFVDSDKNYIANKCIIIQE